MADRLGRPEARGADIKRSHQQLNFQAYDVADPAVIAVLELRETHSHGGALMKGFRVKSDDVLHWFASRNRFSEYDFFPASLSSQAVSRRTTEAPRP